MDALDAKAENKSHWPHDNPGAFKRVFFALIIMLRNRTVAQTSINFLVTERAFISSAIQRRRHARLRGQGERLKHKLAGHTVDPDAFFHEGVLALITCCWTETTQVSHLLIANVYEILW